MLDDIYPSQFFQICFGHDHLAKIRVFFAGERRGGVSGMNGLSSDKLKEVDTTLRFSKVSLCTKMLLFSLPLSVRHYF